MPVDGDNNADGILGWPQVATELDSSGILSILHLAVRTECRLIRYVHFLPRHVVQMLSAETNARYLSHHDCRAFNERTQTAAKASSVNSHNRSIIPRFSI